MYKGKIGVRNFKLGKIYILNKQHKIKRFVKIDGKFTEGGVKLSEK